jgi:hypothetical protein
MKRPTSVSFFATSGIRPHIVQNLFFGGGSVSVFMSAFVIFTIDSVLALSDTLTHTHCAGINKYI